MALNLNNLKKSTTTTSSNTTVNGLNLNKLKKSTTENAAVSSASLNLSKLKSIAPEPNPINPVTQTGFSLSLQTNKVYDLDELIQLKLRDNSEATLILRTITNEELKEKLTEYVTKKILDDYDVSYDDSNYKTQIQYVEQFSRLFDIYFNRYYEEYKKAISSDEYNGSISIDTIFRQIKLTKADIKKYTLGDVAENQDTFISFANRYRPLVIWTDGTPDDGSAPDGSHEFIRHFLTFADFPEVGNEQNLYVDDSENFVYYWDGGKYQQISGEKINYEEDLSFNTSEIIEFYGPYVGVARVGLTVLA